MPIFVYFFTVGVIIFFQGKVTPEQIMAAGISSGLLALNEIKNALKEKYEQPSSK